MEDLSVVDLSVFRFVVAGDGCVAVGAVNVWDIAETAVFVGAYVVGCEYFG